MRPVSFAWLPLQRQPEINCILIRDVRFSQSAARALRTHAALSIVILSFPQLRAQLLLEAFAEPWAQLPITPRTGEVLCLPPPKQ